MEPAFLYFTGKSREWMGRVHARPGPPHGERELGSTRGAIEQADEAACGRLV